MIYDEYCHKKILFSNKNIDIYIYIFLNMDFSVF